MTFTNDHLTRVNMERKRKGLRPLSRLEANRAVRQYSIDNRRRSDDPVDNTLLNWLIITTMFQPSSAGAGALDPASFHGGGGSSGGGGASGAWENTPSAPDTSAPDTSSPDTGSSGGGGSDI